MGPLGSKFRYLWIAKEVSGQSLYPLTCSNLVPPRSNYFGPSGPQNRAPTLLTNCVSKSVAYGSSVQYIESDDHVSHYIYVMYFGYGGGKIMLFGQNSLKELVKRKILCCLHDI